MRSPEEILAQLEGVSNKTAYRRLRKMKLTGDERCALVDFITKDDPILDRRKPSDDNAESNRRTKRRPV